MTKKGTFLRKVGKAGDLMKGSLALTYRKCGKKECRCEKGELHKGYFFSYRLKGKSYGLYVPESLVPKVKKLIDNWKELKGTVEKLTNLNAKLIKKRKI